jgi:hypothetical protein
MMLADGPPLEGPLVNQYYAYFDEVTEGGRVMTHDLRDVTQKTLTTLETEARIAYEETLLTLEDHYRNRPSPNVTVKEDVLCQRVVAPSLSYDDVSARSSVTDSRQGRVYPPRISKWDEFRNRVDNYQIEGDLTVRNQRNLSSIFWDSLSRAQSNCSDEIEEQGKLIDNLKLTLQKSEIVHKIKTRFGPNRVNGRADFCLWKDDATISIMCETKSTHNLRLPIAAQNCVEAYNTAYDTKRRNTREQNPEWATIGHPLGQLIGYMVDNNRRYGALTSATKTYFICALNERENSQIVITDAWCVGQLNYLRAWAYVHSLGCSNVGGWDSPKNWIRSTNKITTTTAWNALLEHMKDDDGNGSDIDNNSNNNKNLSGKRHRTNGCSSKSHGIEHCHRILHQIPIPQASFDDIVVLGAIGFGRNGCCFRVKWNGQEFAMKQFDIGRDGDKYYTNEIIAYMLLRDVWGVLVPRPIFLSESKSGGRLYLGLQLGREPNDKDDVSKFDHVLLRIQKEYGIKHNDAEGRNMIFIPDPNCSAVERIVAIDFEDWDFV